VNKGGDAAKVAQPLPLPQGVPNSAVGGKAAMKSSSAYGMIQGSSNGAVHGNVFGPGGLGTGSSNGLGGMSGSGGLGSRGSGAGGGGYGIGLGGMGVVIEGKLGKKEVVSTSPGTPVVMGSLSKEVIQKVIKRHNNEIRYCYESELQRAPTLSGKVSVMFEIDANGAVVSSKLASSTLNNAAVEACILTKILRWKFPEPTGGGTVKITYPWTFANPAAPVEPQKK
jgi:TonB family protein